MELAADSPNRDGQFNTTHWSVVLLAGDPRTKRAEAALEELCRRYWYPLYAYVRRKGHSPQDAQDLTQEFFARLLEKNYLRLAAPERGKFRSFLLKSLNNFLVNDWIRNNARKRGGGYTYFSLDDAGAESAYQREAAADLAPDSLYDKRWATTLLDRAMFRLGQDYAAAGKRELFDRLKHLLLTEGSSDSYDEVSKALGMSPGATKVAVHRLRGRFRQAVRAEVADTVATPEEVDEELRCLIATLSG